MTLSRKYRGRTKDFFACTGESCPSLAVAWPAMRDDVPVLDKSRQRYRKLAQQMAREGGIRRCLGDNKNTLISATSIHNRGEEDVFLCTCNSTSQPDF